jgi:hypothetical protein
MRESLLSESPGRQNLADAGFEFLRYFQVSNEKLPAADEILRLQRSCHQAFASLIPACYFVGMDNLG